METRTLHRGRLIDHLQLVVKELPPLMCPWGVGEGFFWVELFIKSIDCPEALAQCG